MDWKQGRERNFGFASILHNVFFEKVLGLIPRVDIVQHELRDPSMSWCTDVMRRLGCGRLPTPYNDELFFWWCREVISIDNYPYVGMNYRGVLNIPFPPNSVYGDIGKNFFYIFHFFLFFQIE